MNTCLSGLISLLLRTMLPLVMSAPILLAQNPYAFRLNKSTGLPSNSVYNVLQDSKGFIWLASDEGLSMYDGFKHTTFKCDAQTSTAGSSIQEDALGRIWYENFDGYLYYVDSKRKNLVAFEQSKSIGFVPYGITNEYLFLFQEKGIDVYRIRDLSFVKVIPFVATRLEHANCDGKNYYFIHDNNIFKINDNLELIKSAYLPTEIKENKQLYFDDSSILLLSKQNNNKRIHVLDKALNYIKDLELTTPKFIHGANYIDDKNWILTPEGAVVLNANGQQNVYFPDKSISAVIKDWQGNYWFSSTNEGVFIVPDLKNTIHDFANFSPKKIVKLNDGQLLLGTKKGELLLSNYALDDVQKMYTNADNNEIEYLYADPNNQFVVVNAKGIFMLNTQDFKEILFLNFSIKEICAVDSLYFGFAASGLYGVFENPMRRGEIQSSWTEFLQKFEINDTYFYQLAINIRTRSIAYDPLHEALYFGTNNGLFQVTKSATTEIRQLGQSVYVSKIIVHETDIYVLTTRGNLFKINKKGEFELLNLKYNVPSFEVKLLKRFDDVLIFVSNDNVHSLDLKSGKHNVYSINVSSYQISDLLLDQGYLFILTDEGIIRTHTSFQSTKETQQTRFYINEFLIQGVSRNVNQKIFVPYNENQIAISFSILDFGKSNNIPVYHQFNGGAWELIPTQTRNINFPNLAPGDYHLRFKVGEAIQEQQILFTIQSPIWMRWWFIGFTFLLVLALVVAYYLHKRKQLFKKLALLEEKMQLEQNLSKSVLTSIKAQMNPHFFYNALNTIQAYIFTNDADNASKYLSKFSKLTRKILEMSEADLVKLSEEIDTLKLYLELEQSRFEDDFTFHIYVDDSVDLEMTRLPPMLVQPYVENAIKHGLLHKQGNKTVEIRFEKRDAYIYISIEDNGIGRQMSNELNTIKKNKHKSFATDANAKRIDVLNKSTANQVSFEIIDKMDENNLPAGTCVLLKIPLQ